MAVSPLWNINRHYVAACCLCAYCNWQITDDDDGDDDGKAQNSNNSNCCSGIASVHCCMEQSDAVDASGAKMMIILNASSSFVFIRKMQTLNDSKDWHFSSSRRQPHHATTTVTRIKREQRTIVAISLSVAGIKVRYMRAAFVLRPRWMWNPSCCCSTFSGRSCQHALWRTSFHRADGIQNSIEILDNKWFICGCAQWQGRVSANGERNVFEIKFDVRGICMNACAGQAMTNTNDFSSNEPRLFIAEYHRIGGGTKCCERVVNDVYRFASQTRVHSIFLSHS